MAVLSPSVELRLVRPRHPRDAGCDRRTLYMTDAGGAGDVRAKSQKDGSVTTPLPERSGFLCDVKQPVESLKPRDVREGEAPSEPRFARLGRSLALPIPAKLEAL